MERIVKTLGYVEPEARHGAKRNCLGTPQQADITYVYGLSVDVFVFVRTGEDDLCWLIASDSKR